MATLISNLGGVAGYGELVLPPNDDGFGLFDISSVFKGGIRYFGETYSGLYVNNNGSVSFGAGLSDFTPSAITVDGPVKMIAPFWADADTRGAGSVYVDMNNHSDKVTITWLGVGYFSDHTDKVNSFQLVLTDLGACGFVAEFRYSNISWTTGDFSGGIGGLGGTIATAGWSGANGIDAFQLPQSGNQSQMLNLEGIGGNTGAPGLWQFLIDDSVVNTGGKVPSQRLFDQVGEQAFFAELALAAYSLGHYEIPTSVDHPTNNPSSKADAAHDVLNTQVRWLTSIDLPRLVPVASGNGLFPINGLCNGIYTNQNAAATVCRTSDSLFLTFRGTNDSLANSGFFTQNTPDVTDWADMARHYALFKPLITAIKTYVDTTGSGIDHIYLSGHSLGASMVEALLDNWGDRRIEAVTFANPGYGFYTPPVVDKRVTNIYVEGDPILHAASVQYADGDTNYIMNHLAMADGTTLPESAQHAAILYDAYMQFFHSQGVDIADLRPNNGHNFNLILCEAEVTGTQDVAPIGAEPNVGVATVSIAETADILLGTDSDEILLGGGVADKLYGRAGSDWMIAGTDNDTLVGGKGNDTMTGGAGADEFWFGPNDIGLIKTYQDSITDFQSGSDKINFHDFDAVSGMAGHQDMTFLGNGAFTGGLLFRANGEFRLNGDVIEVDLNGNGVFDISIKVTSTAPLTGLDFIL